MTAAEPLEGLKAALSPSLPFPDCLFETPLGARRVGHEATPGVWVARTWYIQSEPGGELISVSTAQRRRLWSYRG